MNEHKISVDPQELVEHFRQRASDLELELVKTQLALRSSRAENQRLVEALQEQKDRAKEPVAVDPREDGA